MVRYAVTELGQTADPAELIAGSASALFDLSTAWRQRATTAGGIAAHANGLALPVGREGAAAKEFADRRDQVAAGWAKVGKLLSTAADAVESFATTLGWAQQKAEDAIWMWETAQGRTAASMESYRDAVRRAGATDIDPAYVDDGAPVREDAQSLLAYARSEVQSAGDAAADALNALTIPEGTPGAAFLFSTQTAAQAHWTMLAGVVDGTPSAGNAHLRDPDAVLALLAGEDMVAGGDAVIGAGEVASEPGVGAVAAGLGAAQVAADAMGAGGVMLLAPQRGADPGDGQDAISPQPSVPAPVDGERTRTTESESGGVMSRFYYTTNGNSHAEFTAEFRSPKEQLARLLGFLGPDDFTTFSFAPLPDGADFLTFVRTSGSTTFLQCAGTSDAMTIEWRRLDDDGEERLYVVGRGGDRSGPPTVTIRIHGTASTTVYPDEVFDADEATEVFSSYYETELIPDQYQLREYDLTYPKPQP